VELLAAVGLESLEDHGYGSHHIHQRVGGTVVKHYDEMYPAIPDGCLLDELTVPEHWKAKWGRADADSW